MVLGRVILLHLTGHCIKEIFVGHSSLSYFFVDNSFDQCLLTFKLLINELSLEVFVALDQVIYFLESNILQSSIILKQLEQLILNIYTHAIDLFFHGHLGQLLLLRLSLLRPHLSDVSLSFIV